MLNKILGAIGLGLLLGNKTIGSVFGQYDNPVSIALLFVGVLLVAYVCIQWEKEYNKEKEDYKNSSNIQIELLEKISQQKPVENCIKILEEYIESVHSHNSGIIDKFNQFDEHLLAINDTQKWIITENKKLVQESIADKLIEMQNKLGQKVDTLGDIIIKYGWDEESKSKILLSLQEIIKQEKNQIDVSINRKNQFDEFFEYTKKSDNGKKEKLEEIDKSLMSFTDLPKNLQEIVGSTFDELEQQFDEYKQNAQDMNENCFDNMTTNVNNISKKNIELIRKIEDEVAETRGSLDAVSEALKTEIVELTNQTKSFEATMNAILCQLMKMSEEDAKILQEMLNER